ncbi:hypothetical protein I4F81_003517 [Pyropia yezoensis]|uniref:Uncharacterized protein n=1 Tax=Pyropia yezoensis TaxID=2788 RepID=A0ACC3BU12_PYRYE|nr:hypothetical protein I4F81_003517 [Neopyropia yezoensis]
MYKACTHFVYVITVGSSGWCFLKGGQVTAEEATASPLDDPSDASPTTTPALDNPSDTPSNKTTTCNVHKEDCEDTKAAIASRYLNKRCLPRKGNGLLAMSAAALDDAFAAIEAYDCCVRDDDRAKLLSVALLLVVSDTCVALDAAPLPTQTVTAGPTNSTTVQSPQNEPDVPPVDLTINAFGALGVLSGDLAIGATATTQTSRRQVGAKARNSVTLDVSNYEDPHQRACCHDNFPYDNQGCCAGWCWHLADILPFFTLKMCCSDSLTPFELTCPA